MTWQNQTCDICEARTDTFLLPMPGQDTDANSTICIGCLLHWPPLEPERSREYRITIGVHLTMILGMIATFVRLGRTDPALKLISYLIRWHAFDERNKNVSTR